MFILTETDNSLFPTIRCFEEKTKAINAMLSLFDEHKLNDSEIKKGLEEDGFYIELGDDGGLNINIDEIEVE
jgi:hypothetical protein